MSDIIREVDEELRRERYQKLFERYGVYLIGAAILLVAAVGAWRGWEWYQARESLQASTKYEDAIRLAQDGKRFDAEKSFNDLAKDGTSGYRTLARFRAAGEAGKSDRASGVRAYDALAADTSLTPLMRDLARVHAALLLVDTAPVTEIASRMDALNVPTGAYRHSAREILGLAHYRAGDFAAAAKFFTLIQTDNETPPGIRERAQILSSMLSGATPAGTAPTQ
jgi:hypothetical protein